MLVRLLQKKLNRRLLFSPHLLGKWGEKQSLAFLRKKHYKPIARNFTCPLGEIDLIMKSPDNRLVFIEVKTRTSEELKPAHAAVDSRKQKKLRQLANYFIKTHSISNIPIRFDIITVILNPDGSFKINHYPAAF